MKFFLLIAGLLFLSLNVFAAELPGGQVDSEVLMVLPTVQPLVSQEVITLETIAHSEAREYQACQPDGSCAIVFAGLDSVNRVCVIRHIRNV